MAQMQLTSRSHAANDTVIAHRIRTPLRFLSLGPAISA
ncbi:hypothetical protein GPEL0_01r1495 [Geoanaerobacter pelophilus]|uniref:Uncharacterized protein n=1 Tax=Geoanaerobacter pelophilus TaxID=60036 RepID=A0ABQ0MGV0_9BACT|nr:hypothetical protein GPEL0_01r1495 [Geoanaerobacter pelophilus]